MMDQAVRSRDLMATSGLETKRLGAGARATSRPPRVRPRPPTGQRVSREVRARCDASTSGEGQRRNPESFDDENNNARTTGQVDCYGVGMDVQCEVDPAMADPSGGEGEGGGSLLASALAVASLTSPFFFWGTSMVAMKFEAVHTTPLFLGSMRLIPAGAALLLWSKVFAGEERRKVDIVPRTGEEWAKIAAFALVDGTCFQGFLAEGIQRTGAGLGSIIIDSQPISVAIMAAAFLGERVSAKTAFGLAVGVLGLATLELPTEFWGVGAGGDPISAAGEGGDLTGEVFMLLAAQSMAVGTILVRWVCKTIDPVVATGWHMILGGLPLLAAALATEPELAQRLEGLGGADLALLSYITLLGGAASYGIFFVNANKGNLTKLSSLTFLTPVFACIFGNLLLKETFNTSQVAGATITLLGILLVTVEPPKPKAE